MQYYRLIERTLRDAQGILRANLPPAKNLPDDEAVQSLRAIVRTPQVREVLERGDDTALCFVLRAVNRILSDEQQGHGRPSSKSAGLPCLRQPMQPCRLVRRMVMPLLVAQP
jgi:hypothetical protein